VLDFLLVFVPVLGSFIVHAPVLRHDLLPWLRRPLDGGATFRGRRLFGDNKTWRGLLAMWLGVVLAALALSRLPGYWSRLPQEIQAAGALRFGGLLGLGTVLAELPNSFLKRQLDIPPGSRRLTGATALLVILDQGDFVLGIWLTLAPLWVMSPAQALLAFLVVAAAHQLFNFAGYLIGARRTWL
jgi:hypothetical protein